ncbi:MAG: hypothetical protein WD934_05025 [Gemmatimonadales bacterium]
MLLAVLIGCGDSSGPNVTFPALPAELLDAFCVRGDRAPGDAISGTISTGDCQLDDGSYYEVWRVRVGESGTYRIGAESEFDNFVVLLRLESYTGESATLTTIAADDDSGPGFNALIAGASLQVNLDYFVVMNGFGSDDTGPYTMEITPVASQHVAAPDLPAVTVKQAK